MDDAVLNLALRYVHVARRSNVDKEPIACIQRSGYKDRLLEAKSSVTVEGLKRIAGHAKRSRHSGYV